MAKFFIRGNRTMTIQQAFSTFFIVGLLTVMGLQTASAVERHETRRQAAINRENIIASSFDARDARLVNYLPKLPVKELK
jgi:hypothetical protein